MRFNPNLLFTTESEITLISYVFSFFWKYIVTKMTVNKNI